MARGLPEPGEAMTRNARVRVLMAVAVCALCATLAMPASQALGAANTPTYTKESQQAYAQQLASGLIKEAVINRRIGTVRLTLKNGERVKVHYGAHEEP